MKSGIGVSSAIVCEKIGLLIVPASSSGIDAPREARRG